MRFSTGGKFCVLAILKRVIANLDSIAPFQNLPSCRQRGIIDPRRHGFGNLGQDGGDATIQHRARAGDAV